MDGLTGLAALTQVETDAPQATPEQRSGNAADPRHGQIGEQSQPYSWVSQQTMAGSHSVTPTPFVEDSGNEYYGLPADSLVNNPVAERRPWTHDAGPWPADPIGDQSVHPDNVARQLTVNARLHAIRNGQGRNTFNVGVPYNDIWKEIWEVDPGSDDLVDVPDQMKSGLAPGGRGGTDRRQSNAKQNAFGFDSHHFHRRIAAGTIPGNYLYLRPGGRPMVKSLPGPARPAIGPGSPFEGDDLGTAYGLQGAVLQNAPTQYEAPPEPYVAPAAPADQPTYDYTDYYGIGGY